MRLCSEDALSIRLYERLYERLCEQLYPLLGHFLVIKFWYFKKYSHH